MFFARRRVSKLIRFFFHCAEGSTAPARTGRNEPAHSRTRPVLSQICAEGDRRRGAPSREIPEPECKQHSHDRVGPPTPHPRNRAVGQENSAQGVAEDENREESARHHAAPHERGRRNGGEGDEDSGIDGVFRDANFSRRIFVTHGFNFNRHFGILKRAQGPKLTIGYSSLTGPLPFGRRSPRAYTRFAVRMYAVRHYAPAHGRMQERQ